MAACCWAKSCVSVELSPPGSARSATACSALLMLTWNWACSSPAALLELLAFFFFCLGLVRIHLGLRELVRAVPRLVARLAAVVLVHLKAVVLHPQVAGVDPGTVSGTGACGPLPGGAVEVAVRGLAIGAGDWGDSLAMAACLSRTARWLPWSRRFQLLHL